MRRIVTISALALLGLGTSVGAGGLLCKTHCTGSPHGCPDCSSPCDHRVNLALFSGGVPRYIADLSGDDCRKRVKAAEKLGCRCADFCQDPGVLDALIGALMCDTCWEVRRAAAWSLFLQDARTDQAILAVYISSKLDPERRVRNRALEALDLLTLCRGDCYKNLYGSGDVLIKELRKLNYRPGSAGCRVQFAQAWAGCPTPP